MLITQFYIQEPKEPYRWHVLCTARENSVQHITAGNYLVKAVKETPYLEIKDSYGNTMFMAQAPYASTYVGGYDRRGWIQVQIPTKGQ